MNKKAVIALIIACSVFAVTLAIYLQGYFEKPEYYVYDTKVKLFRSDKVPPKNIKVILVDDASLKALEGVAGRWPWPRAIWADLLEFLSLGGARAVLFDILFTERTDALNDGALASSSASGGNVYHSMLITREVPDEKGKIGTDLGLPMPADYTARFGLKNVSNSLPGRSEETNNDYALPIDPLRTAARGVAVVEFSPDSDGVFRRTQPIREYQGKYFPVLGLAPFIDDASKVAMRAGALTVNDRTLPIDWKGNYIINMYGIDKVDAISIGGVFASLKKMKEGDIENLVVNPEEFKDCLVFVGASAVGASDLKPTPLAPNTPGVIFHVSLAANYLLNDFLTPPDRRITVLSIVVAAFLTPWTVFYSKRFTWRVFIPIALLAIYVSYSFIAFKENVIVDLVPFVFSTVSSSFLSFGYLTFTEAAEKRRVSHLFTQYVSKDVLHEVLHNYKEYQKSSAGQKAEITVLFSDIRGFTTFSENTPPERVVEMLNTHFSRMASIILKHGGTLDKYIGDAIMAFWGAPVITKDHAEKAVMAAREMLAALSDVNQKLKERGFEIDLRIGIGINTGVATIGNIGSEQKLNYTVVGDTVNLASRLESITKEYKSPLVFSEYTYEKIKNNFDCTLLGNVKVKGREQPVTIYTVE